MQLYQIIHLCTEIDGLDHQFFFKERALIWNKAKDFCLSGDFKVCIW